MWANRFHKKVVTDDVWVGDAVLDLLINAFLP